MSKKSPVEIRDLLSKIDSDSESILVGGQAINLWATAYQDKIPELEEYLPFSSEDLDFIGGKIEAVEMQECLGGHLEYPQSFSPTPNTAILTTTHENQKLRIDFLGNVFGLDTEQVASSAIVFRSSKLPNVKIKVLNPILCLTGKLKSYIGLPQHGRQDKKHLQIAMRCARQYIKEICLQDSPRPGLRLVEKISKTAKTEAGLKVWQRDGIDLTSVIPTETITSLPQEQWQKFSSIRLPAMLKEIEDKRSKYQKIVANQNARTKKIKRNKGLEK